MCLAVHLTLGSTWTDCTCVFPFIMECYCIQVQSYGSVETPIYVGQFGSHKYSCEPVMSLLLETQKFHKTFMDVWLSLGLLGHKAPVGQLASQPVPASQCFLTLDPTQNCQLHSYEINGLEQHAQMWHLLPPNSKKSIYCALCGGQCKVQQLAFHIKKIYLQWLYPAKHHTCGRSLHFSQI